MQFLFLCSSRDERAESRCRREQSGSRRGSRLRNSSWRARNSPRFATEHPASSPAQIGVLPSTKSCRQKHNRRAGGKRRLTLERAPRLILESMAECCCPEPDETSQSIACRACGTAGIPVESLTVKALLTESALARYEHGAYRFCPGGGCAVVYFTENGATFRTEDVRERVWQKEPAGHRTLCYCFGENEAAIAEEIQRTGDSRTVSRVRAHIAAKRCACEVRNPRGACCLGDLNAAVKRLRSISVPRS